MGTGKTYSTKYLLDSNNSSGVAGQVLSTTSTGIDWVDANTVPGTGLWLASGNNIYNSNSANVGIGTTSPLALLSVGSGSLADTNVAVQISTSGGTSQRWFGVNKNGSYGLLMGYLEGGSIGDGGAGAYIRNITEDPLYFMVSNSDLAMTILANKNVGIGTTLPSTLLQVNGTGITTAINDGAYTAGYFARLSSLFGSQALKLTSRCGDILRGSDYGASVTILTGGTTSASVFISSGKAVQFNGYSSTNFVGTPTYLLGTDASGNIVKTNTVPGSGAGPYLPLSAGSTKPLTGSLYMSGASTYVVGGDSEILVGQDAGGYYLFTGFSPTVSKPVYIGDNASFISINAGGSTRMRIDGTTGNVGIGVTGPLSKLTIDAPVGNFANGTNAISLNYDGGSSPGDVGGGIVFSQEWWSASAGQQVTGGIYGIKNAGNGVYGGGLAFYTQPSSAANMAQRMIIDTSGNVGIGTTGPLYKLQVIGPADAQGFVNDEGGNKNRLLFPKGGSFNSNPTTGAITVKLPVLWTNTMLRITLRVYDYAQNESFDVTVAGYNYTGGYWVNTSAWISSQSDIDKNFSVRFGNDGSNALFYIGELNSSWSYLKVNIVDVELNHSATVANWSTTAWSISMETTAFANVNQTRANCQVNNWKRNGQDVYYGSGTGNVGIGVSPETGSKLHIKNTAAAAKITLETTNSYDSFINYSGASNEMSAGLDFSEMKWTIGNGGDLTTALFTVKQSTGDTVSAGNLTLGDIANETTDTDKFLVSNAGLVKYITGTQMLSFIGAAPAGPGGVGYLPLSAGSSYPLTGDLFINNGFTLSWGADTTKIAGSSSTNELSLITASTTRMRIDQVGNVGIGTTNPSSRLEIKATSATHKLVSINRPSSDTAALYIGNDSASPSNGIISSNYSDLIFGRDQSGTLSEWMRIKRDGNVGIGTTNPAYKLVVYETGTATSNVAIDARATGAGTNNYAVWAEGSGASSTNFAFYGAAGKNAFLGDTGIGTDNPNEKLEVNGAVAIGNATDGIKLRLTGTVGEILGLSTTSGSYNDLDIRTQAATQLYLKTDGNVGIGTASPSAALEVVGGIKLSDNSPLAWATSNTRIIGQSGYMQLQVAVSDVMRLTSAGNVGIGTTSPGNKLSIAEDMGTTFSDAFLGLKATLAATANTKTAISLATSTANNYGVTLNGIRQEATSGEPRFGINMHNNSSGGIEALSIRASGNVGIGTTGPNDKLEVSAGNIRISNNSPILRFIDTDVTDLQHRVLGGGNAGLEYSADVNNVASGYHRWDISNSEKMRLIENGNLGIGTTSPGTALHVVSGGIGVQGTSGSAALTAPGIWMGGDGTSALIYGREGSTWKPTYLDSSALYINAQSGGNVGIGTTSPGSKLQVAGEIRVADGNKATPSYSFTNDPDTGMFSDLANTLRFGTGANTRMTIEPSGEVGINTTGPSAALHLRALTTNGVPFKLEGDSNTTVEQMLIITSKAFNSSDAWYNLVAQAGDGSGGATNTCIIERDGDLRNKNNSYGQISDSRLKENITDATPKLDDVMKVKVKNFNFIGEDLKQIGVVAQELEEVFPGLVKEDKQPDVNGEEGGIYKSVKYSVLVPILLKAMQEQQDQIEDLKTRITQLEN